MKTTQDHLQQDTDVAGLLLASALLRHPPIESPAYAVVAVAEGVLSALALWSLIRGQVELTRRLELVRHLLGVPRDVRMYPHTLTAAGPVLPAYAEELHTGLARARTSASHAVAFATWAALLGVATALVAVVCP